ncbi:unnamed protein product, partial [Mesorhabditis belari]|uniref:Serpentine receptor class gamma n=2 Tax=Mesorhabditis belari TaxID=2138241 RepID=A0AAF3F9S6_9BILA
MEYYFFIYCIYGIPSAILNLSLIICILINKTLLQTSFYRVYAFTLIVLWIPRNINFAFLLTYLIGILFSYQYFFLKGSLYVRVGDTVVQGRTIVDEYLISIYIVKFMSFIYPIISLGINILILIKLFLLRRTKTRDNSWSRVKLNLFFICFCTMITQLGLWLFVTFGLQLVELTMISFMMNLVSDLSTLSEAYIGLAINKQMRGKLIEIFHKIIDIKSISQRVDITS